MAAPVVNIDGGQIVTFLKPGGSGKADFPEKSMQRKCRGSLAENVVGFFAVLGEWSRFDRPIPANATRKPASLSGRQQQFDRNK